MKPFLRPASLHPSLGIDEADLHQSVDVVRKNGPGGLSDALHPKIRRNAITAVFIEEYWRYCEEQESALPQSHGLPADEVEALASAVELKDLSHAITDIQGRTDARLLICLYGYVKDSNPLVQAVTSVTAPYGSQPAPMFPDRIVAGLQNANKVSWQSIHVLPHVWEREKGDGKNLTAEQYQALAVRNIALIRTYAHAQMDLFATLEQMLHPTRRFPAFAPERLTLVGEGKNLRLELSNELRAALDGVREIVDTTVATGCPALYAKASDGKDVVSSMYDWTMRVAKKILFPATQKILQQTELNGSAPEQEARNILLRGVLEFLERSDVTSS